MIIISQKNVEVNHFIKKADQGIVADLQITPLIWYIDSTTSRGLWYTQVLCLMGMLLNTKEMMITGGWIIKSMSASFSLPITPTKHRHRKTNAENDKIAEIQ